MIVLCVPYLQTDTLPPSTTTVENRNGCDRSLMRGKQKHRVDLGLAIAQEIIQAHDGKIGVRSQVGHGTLFVIHLPLAA